ncbi:MAG: hypothetical protein RJA44_173 [Pseudomonadota bacterium]|jgi:CRP-like cAMP-binding protein
MSSSRIELLQRMPIFHGIREDTLQCLIAHAPTVTRQVGEFFFRQGDEALYMYVLESGRVSVHKVWNDRELELGMLGPGDCFGEIALIDMSPRSASIRVEQLCTATEISAVDLHRVYEYDVEQFILVQTNIARELCRRLRLTDEKLMRTATPQNQAITDLDWPQLLSF